MTKILVDKDVLEQALEDICGAKLCEVNSMSSRTEMLRLMDKAITALKAALAEPVQEPVACSNTFACRCPKHYTAPPQRKPLTEEEILRIKGQFRGTLDVQFADFARAVERAHGIGE